MAPRIDGVLNEILKKVITVNLEILLEAFISFLWERKFFKYQKNQRLALLRTGEKSLDKALSYRPKCLLETMKKLIEWLILQKFQSHMVSENNLSKNQFGYRKGRSKVDAIQAVVDIATKTKRELVGERNYARWSGSMYAMRLMSRD